MEETDCFGLDWVPSVDGAPSIEAKNQIATSKKFLLWKTCLQNILEFFLAVDRPGAETSQGIVLVPHLEFTVGKEWKKQEGKSFMFSQDHQENVVERKAKIVSFSFIICTVS